MRLISVARYVCLAGLVAPLHADSHLAAAQAADAMGISFSDSGRFAEAEEQLERALFEWRQYLGPHDIALVRVVTRLAGVYVNAGDVAKAERLNLEGWLDRLRSEAPGRPEMVQLLQDLGALDSLRGRHDLARQRFEEALARSDSGARAATLNDFGLACLRAGEYDDAIAKLTQSRALWNDKSAAAGVASFNLARAYQAAGRFHEAEFPMREALAIAEVVSGPEGPRTGEVLAAYSVLLERMNRKSEARKMAARADRILRAQPARQVVDVTELSLHSR